MHEIAFAICILARNSVSYYYSACVRIVLRAVPLGPHFGFCTRFFANEFCLKECLFMNETTNISELFGQDVFNDTVMCERLPKRVYAELKKTMEAGAELDPTVADVVASAMKDWAIERGATHYTHWFQPMTGITAEKHDSFIHPLPNGKAIMEFSGKELIKLSLIHI